MTRLNSRDGSPRPSVWYTSNAPYLSDPLRALWSPRSDNIVTIKPSAVGKSEADMSGADWPTAVIWDAPERQMLGFLARIRAAHIAKLHRRLKAFRPPVRFKSRLYGAVSLHGLGEALHKVLSLDVCRGLVWGAFWGVPS